MASTSVKYMSDLGEVLCFSPNNGDLVTPYFDTLAKGKVGARLPIDGNPPLNVITNDPSAKSNGQSLNSIAVLK